jgi:hypothetical protein
MSIEMPSAVRLPDVTRVPVSKCLVRLLHEFVVHPRKDGRHELHHGDPGAEPAPHGSELEADHASADDNEVLGNMRDPKRPDVREDALLVELEERQLHRKGAGGDDDVSRLIRRGSPGRAGDVHHIRGGEGSPALGPRHLVLLEQELDAARILADHVILALQHLRQIELYSAQFDPVILRMAPRELEVFRAREERLGGNAADVHARAAERLVHLDAHGAQSKLAGADRGDVTTRATADHNDVNGLLCRGWRGHRPSLFSRWPSTPGLPAVLSPARGTGLPAVRR